MSIISCVFFKSYYYFLICWIIDFITYLINQYKDDTLKYDNMEFIKLNDYLYLISLNISDLLAGFLVLVTYCHTKSEKKEEKKIKPNSIELIYNDLSIKENKLIYIVSLSTLDLIGRSTTFLYHLFLSDKNSLETKETIWLISIDIIARIIFSRIILKTILFKHHYASVILFTIGFLPLIIWGIYQVFTSICPMHILFLIPKNILFAIGDILSKILLTNKFVLPQYLMFWKGLFNFGMHLIIFPIIYFTHIIKFIDDNNNTYFSNYTLSLVLLRILYIILSFVKGFCIMKIIYLFSPHHVAFVNVVTNLTEFFIFFIYKQCEAYLAILNLLCFIIIIIGTLVFNEILILNFFGLNKDVKTNIIKRGEKEKKETLEMNSTIINDTINDEEEANETLKESLNDTSI